jgi:CRISPR system Cascade subunit CasE
MFLSKITLVPTSQSAVELAILAKNGVYASHQLLWKLFPNDSERNFIYREEQGSNGRPFFFVLSKNKPHLIDSIFEVHTKRFTPVMNKGDRLAFKLRMNPTICVSDSEGKSRRHDVMMHAKKKAQSEGIRDSQDIKILMKQAAIAWFAEQDRLTQWGISLDCLPDIESYMQHASQKKRAHSIKFSSVNYQGILTLVDPEVFRQKYAEGFGRSKAMGCGLMLIRPV